MENLRGVIGRFPNVNILIIGDVMLDSYIWGNVSRISPEAPVQVVRVKKESYSPGGAANVAANVGALGGNTLLVGVTGKDDTKRILTGILRKHKVNTKGVLIDRKKPTTRKVRIIAQNQQLLRVDYENPEYISKEDEKRALDFIRKNISKVQAVVISDYAKGMITEHLIRELEKMASKERKPVLIDPKPSHDIQYRGATLITPNSKEAFEMAGMKDIKEADIMQVGKKIVDDTDSNVLVTRGERGMSLFKRDRSVVHIPTMAKEVYDVTGAGDTVMAALALSIGAGASLEDAAIIANHAAGITVAKVGTSTVTRQELMEGLDESQGSIP